MVKRGTMGANMAPLLTGNFRWWNKVDALSTQYLIYTDSYTTERTDQANSVPVCWSTPDLNDQSLVNLINTIPERVGDFAFTNINPALYWLQNTNKYFLLKNGYENIVTDGLVLNLDAGWYDSYPAAGSTWTDLSTSSYNATLYNNPTFGSTDGGYIDFDGSDDYGSLGNISALSFTGGVFTAEAWVYIPSTWTSGSQYPNLISKGASAGWDNAGWSLFVFRDWPNSGNYSWGCGIRQGGTALITPNYNVPSNTFLHIVATADGSNVRLYQNGVLVNTSSQTVVPETNIRDVLIGRDWQSEFFPGNLALTRLYNKALSATEIQQNYNAQKTRFGLTSSPVITTNLNVYLDASNTASYPGSGNNWYDISGVNNSAELLNGPSFSTDGGGCINFDGTDDRARIPQNTDLYGNTFTWEFWVKFDAFPNTYSGMVWAEGSTGGGSGLQYLLTIQNNSGTRFFHYRVHNTGNGWTDTNTSTIDFTPTNWTHIVWTFDNGTTKIYTQGALFHTNADRGPYNGGTDSPVFIAGRNDSFGSADGKFAMVNHYTTALNGTQVTSNYNSTKSKFGY